jgi:hypothetical protein
MTIDEVNAELQLIAADNLDALVEAEYEEFLEQQYQLWELDQYANDCYDLDAEFYGALK